MSNTDIIKDRLNEKEAAEILGLSVRTLQKWRWEGKGPDYTKIGRFVTYRKDKLTEFVEKRTISPSV